MSDTAGAAAGTPSTLAAHRPVDLPTLTGLRAVAAGVVVVHHLRPLVDLIAPDRLPTAVRSLLMSGMLGLDLFFALSGFIIAHTYAHRLAAPAPGRVRDYLVARLARVYPLHLATLFVFCVILVVGATVGTADYTGQQHTLRDFVANVFMLQGVPGVTPWNFPSWSITFEFAAYLVFPLFAARVLAARWSTALVVAVLALSLQLVVMFQLGGADPGSTTMGLPRIAGEFTAGAMAWVVWRHVLRPGRWADVVVVLCTVGVSWLVITGHSWLWAVPLIVALIPAVACATGPIGTVLAHPVAQWGGRISFAVYLVHILVVTATIMWVIPEHMYLQPTGRGAAVVLVGILLVTVAFGALLHHGVEEPARHWVRRRLTPGGSAKRARERARDARVGAEDTRSGVGA